MDSTGYAAFTFFFFLCLSLSSGTIAAEKPPPKPAHKSKVIHQEQKILESSSTFTSQRDTTTGTIPIVNPSTPGIVTPIINPAAPIINPASPPPPIALTPALANPTTPTTTSSGGAWCIAMPSASQTALQVALDYACGYRGADCSGIQPGASCYDPNTLQDHASYAFNDYYQKNPVPTSCVFGGTAQLTYTDPSQGNCHYSSSRSSTPVTPPTTVTPTPVIPSPVIPSPFYATPTPTEPGGSTVYGVAEPTGSPSSATSATFSLIVVITTGLLASVMAAAYL